MSKLLKLTMTDGREVLVSVKAAYDAGPHCTEEHHISKECSCQQIEWKLCPICEWEHQEDQQICSDCSKH